MTTDPTSLSTAFSERLLAHATDDLERFVQNEVLAGRPYIFASDEDTARFQLHVATALDISNSPSSVLIVGSARTGFSLDPDRPFQPFGENSDIDVVVVHEGLFDHVWKMMLAWDYVTMRNRAHHENVWLWTRHAEVWRGWFQPPGWDLRPRGGVQLSFPESLKPLREFSFIWFSAFRSLSRYRHHPEISRRKVTARLYRTRVHAALYHAWSMRKLRANLMPPPAE